MRTTVFAFMGLTAAGGLALVAIFVQMGFPVASPAPLPNDPSQFNAVAEAEVVTASQGVGAASPATRAGEASGDRRAEGGIAAGGSVDDDRGNPAPPAPLPTPAVPVSPADPGGVAVSPSHAPKPTPAPAPSTAQPSTSAPARSPVAAAPSTPEATPPQPVPPAPVAAPGNSASTAAAEHASPRGIEASSSAGGKALGHDK